MRDLQKGLNQKSLNTNCIETLEWEETEFSVGVPPGEPPTQGFLVHCSTNS